MTFDETKGPGRVFFSHENKFALDWVAYQPLENHVGNVRELMKAWRTDTDAFDLAIDEARLQKLYEGATFHDWGKTKKFSIRKKSEGWTYSYAGHRFLNPSELEQDPYALTLERAHHDFSTQEIVKDAYNLKYQSADYKTYPKDLFVLEMCDQIEAEVAVMAVHNLDKGRNSSFMEFEVGRIEVSGNVQTFSLEPFPFEGDITYEVVVRRDNVKGDVLSKCDLEQRGFSPYENLERITIQLQSRYESEQEKIENNDITAFYRNADGLLPNSLQEEVWRCWKTNRNGSEGGKIGLIVKAPTGTGKTEACSYPALAQNKRVVLVLPAKALVDDHAQRFKRVLSNLSCADKKLRRLLIDTGDNADIYTFTDNQCDNSKNQHNHLYRADVILTTLDKFLYRFFGYGGGHKSYTYPLRLGDTSRMAFIFDEAHSYEGTAFTNFQRLTNTLYDNGHSITLMTATLPEAYQRALQDPEDFGFAGRWDVVDFLEDNKQQELKKGKYYGERHLNYLPDDGEAWDVGLEADAYGARREAFDAHKQDRIARVIKQIGQHWTGQERLIVTLDRVADAVEVYKHFRDEFGLPTLREVENPQVFLYHGRLDRRWRSGVYRALKARDDAKQPYLLISTSAIEIGVDLDAQGLITELCNPDALVQRMGRCNRRGENPNVNVTVVGSQIPAYLDAFGANRAAFGTYLHHLGEHHDKKITGGFSKQIMSDFPKPVLSDPRAATAYDMLHSYVYNFDLEYHNLHQLGFIATRSWEPALEILIPQRDSFDVVQVPVSRMSRSTDDAEWAKIEQYKWERDTDKSWRGRWEEATYGGDLYRNNYRIRLLRGSKLSLTYERDLGLVDLPQIFQRQHWASDPPLKTRLRSWSFEAEQTEGGALFFASDKVEGKSKGKSFVFNYLADPELLVEV